MEMIEAKKQKRPSISSLFEASQMRRSVDANAKPGKSTHPYDTGVGDNTGKPIEETTEEGIAKSSAIRSTPKRSMQMERPTTKQESTPRTLNRFLDAPPNKPAPGSSRDGTPSTTSQERNELKYCPEPHTESSILGWHKIAFRSMLGSNKNQRTLSNTTPSTATSASPNQPSTTSYEHRSWWPFKKQKSSNDRYSVTEPLMINEEEDDLAMSSRPHRTHRSLQNRNGGSHPKNRAAKKSHKNGKSGEGVEKEQQTTSKQWEKTERLIPQQPNRVSHEASKNLGPKQQKWYRRSPSSSQARPSTDRTRATPATQRDSASEHSRTETPPIWTTQALRLCMGTGRSPSSKAATQMELASPGTATSTSTLLIKRPSRESRTSADHRNRNWIPFWPSPKPPFEHSQCRGVDEQQLPIEPDQGDPKGCLGRVSRKGWRSG